MFRNQRTLMLRHNVCAQAEKRFNKKRFFDGVVDLFPAVCATAGRSLRVGGEKKSK
jgi:hypothetical protein